MLTSLPVLCPFLFPWHRLWQDETVVVCLPVYTCCADLLLLYSRHRQADRWQPHWHQNRTASSSTHINKTTGALLEWWRQYQQMRHFSVCCSFKRKCASINKWWPKFTAVVWLRYFPCDSFVPIILLQFQQVIVQRWMSYLIILEPGQALCCEDKPVLSGSTLHDANVADGQPALAYDLHNSRG